MHRIRTLVGILGALTPAALLATPSPATAQPTAAGAPALATPTVTVQQVDDAGAQLRALGETQYGSDYAGVSVDEAVLRSDLYVTSLSSTQTQSLVQAAGAVPVVTHLVARSYVSLTALQSQVASDSAYWSGQGVQINVAAIDVAANAVSVGIDPYSDTSAAALEAHYGPAVEVVPQTTYDETATRFADSPAYNGGDYLQNEATTPASCTAGTPVHEYYTGAHYWLVAGHCWAAGSKIDVNLASKGGTVARAGSVADRSWFKTGGIDVELVSATTSNLIWETDSSRATQDGQYPRYAKGTTVCHSGYVTNKVCATISATNASVSVDGVSVAHQDTVTSTGTLVEKGDSGGPWFNNATGTVHSIGIQSAGASGTSCTDRLGRANTCYKVATYTEMYWILNTYAQSPTYMALIVNS